MRQRAMAFFTLSLVAIAFSVPTFAAGPASEAVIQSGGNAQNRQFGQEEKPDPELQKKLEKARLEERYNNLKRDSEKLLELATELKQYVDKSNQNVLSMEVVRKCNEIEKLAKSVRSKMKGD